ncbi:MAG: methyl-accepting chemotaxis protein [Verrucomicrobia bacterium]|nr:methyl-accepting chemotaxis protein [Verrucomicrobiota bacterium]
MTLRTRLLLLFGLFTLVLLPVIGWVAYDLAGQALTRDASARLEGIRQVLADAVEREIEGWRAQTAALADGRQTREALAEFARGVENLESDLRNASLAVDDSLWLRVGSELRANYESSLLRSLSASSGTPTDAATWMPGAKPALLLQHALIAANPAPAGRKGEMSRIEELIVSPDLLRATLGRTRYAHALQRHRPGWELLATRGPLSDLALVDASGFVLATLRQTHLLGQDLRAPQHRASAPARAFRAAMLSAGDPARRVVLEDATPSEWDGNDPSFWLACPVEDDASRRIGAVVVRVSAKRLSSLTRFKGREEQIGLGESGAALLVGPDGLLRSEHRFAGRLAPGSLRRVANADGSRTTPTAVLAPPLAHHPAVRALNTSLEMNGNTGVVETPDDRGEPALWAYGPVRADDLGWGALVYVTRAEGLAAATTLRNTMLVTLGSFVLLGIVGAWWLAGSISRPFKLLADTAARVASGDARLRAAVGAANSEAGQTAIAFNKMLDALEASRSTAERNHRELREDVGELSSVAAAMGQGDLRVRSTVHRGEAGRIADALNAALDQLNEVVRQSRDLSADVARGAAETSRVQETALSSANDCAEAALRIHDLAARSLSRAEHTAIFATSTRETMSELVRQAEAAHSRMGTLSDDLSGMVELARKTTSDLKTAVENIAGAERRTDQSRRLATQIGAHALNLKLAASQLPATSALAGKLQTLADEITASAQEASKLALVELDSMRATMQAMRAAMTAGEGQAENISTHEEFTRETRDTFARLQSLVSEAAPSLEEISEQAVELRSELEHAAGASNANASHAQASADAARDTAARAAHLRSAAQQLEKATRHFQV